MSTSSPAIRDQFEPRRENGYLYGRGAYDMKGALAAMLAALADLAAAPEGLAGRAGEAPDRP